VRARDNEDYPQARTIPGLVMYRYDSPLFFANAQDFQRRALAAVEAVREELTGRGIVSALAHRRASHALLRSPGARSWA
jgi:MFS superfamily sulfate permease-like transporter